jgi:DNA-binding transcriptional LysR family regulator
MQLEDLRLLVALDALLEQASVTGAAGRMNRSVSAMRRTLGRLPQALGDPILVRAGRRLVLTSRAEMLRPQVHLLVEGAAAVLKPDRVDLASLQRTFTIRANDAFVTAFASQLAALVSAVAPVSRCELRPRGTRMSTRYVMVASISTSASWPKAVRK